MAGLWALELEEADTRRNWEGLDLGITLRDFPGGSDGKASAYSAGDLGLIPGSGRFSGGENGNPLQYPYLENPMEGGA